jgi:excisionase family DNA binding protein
MAERETRGSSRLLTTGEVARLCGFSTSAVLKWIRSGKLPAYSSPGGKNRVARKDLVSFLKKNRMRIAPELTATLNHRVLVLTDDSLIRESVGRMLAGLDSQLDVEFQHSLAGAMLRVGSFQPHVFLVDMDIPKIDVADLCQAIKGATDTANVEIVPLARNGRSVQLQRALRAGAQAWVRKPVDFGDLAGKVGALLGIGPAGAEAQA